jgi:benzodiazapine receptor
MESAPPRIQRPAYPLVLSEPCTKSRLPHLPVMSSILNIHRAGAPRAVINAVVAIAIVAAASWVGSKATLPAIPGWYASIQKPWFNPPNWVFGPVWTLLYAMIAYAFWRVLQAPAGSPGRTVAITLFVVQISLNALWSVVFFGMQSPGMAVPVVLALEAAILLTIAWFRPIDRVSAWLLVPYAVWVGFASLLNITIVFLNR